MNLSNYFKPNLLAILLSVTIGVVALFLLNVKVGAQQVSNQLPSDNTFLVVSGDVPTGGSFSSPDSYAYLYVPDTQGTVSLTVSDIGNGRLSNMAIQRKNGGSCNNTAAGLVADYDNGLAGFSTTRTISGPSTSSTDEFLANVNGTLVNYRVYCVVVSTSAALGIPWYSNVTFKMSTSTPQALLGVYPGSTIRQGTGYFAANGSKWSMALDFAVPCQAPASSLIGPNNPIRLYDLDNGYSQTPNIEVYLQIWDRDDPPNGSGGGTLIGAVQLKGKFNSSTGLSDLRFSRFGFGLPIYFTEGWYPSAYSNNYTWDFWPKEDFPSNADLEYSEDYVYRLGIIGIGRNNKIRVRLPFDQANASTQCPVNNPDPVGFADSCRLEGGRTVIYGWSYDADSANTSQPSVRVRLSGQPDQTVTTPYNYRTTQVNNYLNARPEYAGGPKDNRYGFRAEYTALYKGSSFSLSGTLLNVGPGANSTMGVNQATGPPDGGITGSFGFPGRVIPQQCLADPPMPSCTVIPSPNEVQINRTFRFQVRVIADPAGAYTVSTIAYSSTPNIASGTYTVPASSRTISGSNRTFTVANPTANSVGDVRLSATINTNFGSIPCSNNATAGSTVTFTREPYVRTYGNDVSVGRGFWDTSSLSCPSGPGRALGHGSFRGTRNQSTYRGAAAQLAVFAVGQIGEVLPGSQVNRNPATQLSFGSSSGVNLPSLQFGGNFTTNNVPCIHNYYDDRPTGSPTPASLVNLSTLPSGTYYYTSQTGASDVLLTTGTGQISNQLVIYVDGDVYLATNGGTSIPLVDSWANASSIPSLYVIASGDIYMSYSLNRVDGTYISEGEIHTCSFLTSLGSGRYRANNLISPTVNESVLSAQGVVPTTAGCQQKLFIYGSLIANKVNFLRSNGTEAGGAVREGPAAANIAEVIQFTPEVYLNDGGGLPLKTTEEISIDSIISLPPSF